MGFLLPEFLLLFLPAAFAWWRWRDRRLGTRVLRAVAAGVLLLALAEPYLTFTDEGRDLIFVVDRSRSMPAGSRETTLEMVHAIHRGEQRSSVEAIERLHALTR